MGEGFRRSFVKKEGLNERLLSPIKLYQTVRSDAFASSFEIPLH